MAEEFTSLDDLTPEALGGVVAPSNQEEVTPVPQEQPQAASVEVSVAPDILQDPKSRKVIEDLQSEFGGAEPIFTPGDARQEVWDAHVEQQRTLNPPEVGQEGKQLIPGDAANAVVAGARDALVNTGDFVGDVVGLVAPATGAAISEASNSVPKIATEGPGAEVTRTISRYILGAVGAGKIKALKKAGTVVAGAIGDFVVTGKEDKGLSEISAEALIEQHPGLQNPIIDYLAAPDKGEFDKRFIAALEGVLLVKGAESVFKAVRHLKGAKEGGATTVDEVLTAAKAADEAPTPTTPKVADEAAPTAKAADNAAAPAKPTPQKEAIALDDASREVYLRGLRESYKDGRWVGGDMPEMPEGVLNWDKMGSDVEVQGAVQKLTETIHGHLEDVTGGVQSFDQTTKLAEEVAEMAGAKDWREVMAPLTDMGGDAKMITARFVAAKQMMQSVGREIMHLSTKIDNGIASSADEVELLRRVDILTELTSTVKGAQTAAARMTSAGRIKTADAFSAEDLVKIIDEVGGSEGVEVLARRIRGSGGKIAEMSKVIKGGRVGKAIAIHNEVWLSGILSGVKTHIVNMSSNLINAAIRPGSKYLGAKLTGQPEIAAEALAQYKGMMMSIGDSMELATRSFKMEGNILDLTHKTNEGLEYAIRSGDGKLSGDKWDALLGGDVQAGWDLMINGFGKFVRMPSRFLMAEDEFFKQLNYRGHIYAQSHRRAINGGLEVGSDAYKAKVGKYFDGSFDEVGRGTNNSALRWSQEATFTNDLKAETFTGAKTISETLQAAAIRHPVLRGTVLPFIRTPANLMRQVWDHSPLAPLRKQFHADLAAGGERRAMAAGKLATGGMIWAAAGTLAVQGLMTGGGPTDPGLRKEWMAAGNEPYSIKVGDEWISYQRLDPFASLLGIAADYNELTDVIDQDELDQQAVGMSVGLGEMLWRRAGAGGTSFVSNISGKSYLQGLTELLSLISRGGMNKERMTELTLSKRVGSYVPSYMQMYTSDPEVKHIRTAMDAIKAKSPWHSTEVEAKRDYMGQKILRGEGPLAGANAAVNPFHAKEPKNDRLRDEVVALGESSGQAVFQPLPEKEGSYDLVEWKGKSGQSAYDRLQELMGTTTNGRGENLREKMLRKMDSTSYQKSHNGNRAYGGSKRMDALRKVRTEFVDRAWKKMLKEPDFLQLADALKIDRKNERRSNRRSLDELIKLPQQ